MAPDELRLAFPLTSSIPESTYYYRSGLSNLERKSKELIQRQERQKKLEKSKWVKPGRMK